MLMKKKLLAFKDKIFSPSHILTTEIFQRLDIQVTAQKLNLEKEGHLSGQEERPDKDSTTNDVIENKIVSLIEEEKVHSYDEARKWLDAYNERIKSLGIEQ